MKRHDTTGSELLQVEHSGRKCGDLDERVVSTFDDPEKLLSLTSY